MRAAVLYGILGSLALTGLAAAPAADAARTGSAVPVSRAAEGPEARGVAVAAARAAGAGVDFGPCPAAEGLPAPVECGTVAVPMDYARPGGRQLRLTVTHIGATGPRAERQGKLVFNPGGPGASGTYFPLLSRSPEWRRLAEAYDFVGYAPRGVERSGALSCQDPDEFMKAPSNTSEHPSEREKRARIQKARAYADGCARIAGLRHYTSLNNARDLEVLRAALGERRLTYLGASYGTYFGSLYAALYPGHVRRMVFDSPVDPDPGQIWYGSNLRQSAAFEERWADWQRWVARHDDVYRLGRSRWEVAAAYRRARKMIEKEPAGGRIGTAQLQAGFLRAAYNDGYWAPAAGALADYLDGKPRTLVEFAADDPSDNAAQENGNAVYTAVECNDAPWPTDWETWDRDNSRLARVAPFETWENAWMNLPCAFWAGPRQQPLDVRTAAGELPPVLLLAAERDAATPYDGARELARRLGGSADLVTEKDAGSHGLAGGENACVNAYVDTYLLTGRTPGDANCAPRPEPRAQRDGTRSVAPGTGGPAVG
ncbi:alpha/beta hydrolase [Streptomyces sp. WMMC500]|uniref:alpha/beta hydrolase n=1 Tax=Streptomyces sp. WMMC500 TaxID=3015154 RepID=UPI00248B73BE|nr:alpha/beta hydrolase [Streptomyces sp. WMMC500]WBB62278.1 alpha/beta hydrolase [Streptomyces sp. WMMC500]